MAVFCRQFVSIVEAGVPITAALEMLAEQTQNKILSDAISHCHTSIQTGTALSDAMREQEKVFPEMFVTMVAAGEASGSLDVSFERKASVYPIIIGCVAFAVIMVLLGRVVPEFEGMLFDLGLALPLITRIVVGISQYVQSGWYVILLVIGIAAILLGQFGKTDLGRRTYGTWGMKAPLFGELTVKTASARSCRTLSTLIAAGIPLIEAIDIVSRVMTNIHYTEAFQAAKDDVSMGAPLSEPILASGIFPPMVCHMIKIGEETGDLEGMLDRLSDYYDEEVEFTTQAIMSALEPILIVGMAGIVAVIVGAVMIPMADMYAGLDNL